MPAVRLPVPRTAVLILIASFCALPNSAGGAAPGTFTNPVYAHDFADPFVLRVGHTYYAYATQARFFHIPVLASRDLVHWVGPREVLPALPHWTLPGEVWAPSVVMLSAHRFLMYYATQYPATATQCITIAASGSPAGPFRDWSSRPFLCASAQGGAIDPAVFRDSDGRLYLYWKNDGNSRHMPTHIYVQRLSADGLKLLTPPRSLAVNDQSWEGDVIEGPTMWRHGDGYYLFYSGGYFASPGYAAGYSTCRTAMGPCRDYTGNPILRSHCRATGPGGETIIADRTGQTWIFYHAWLGNRVNLDPGRVLWLDRLDWPQGRPVVRGPTCGPQRAPVA